MPARDVSAIGGGSGGGANSSDGASFETSASVASAVSSSRGSWIAFGGPAPKPNRLWEKLKTTLGASRLDEGDGINGRVFSGDSDDDLQLGGDGSE
jgi:hypothetical protein